MKNSNLFQIGEVANLLGISRKMILDYENDGLIKPSYIDEFTGYRYFDSITIAKLHLILDLRKADMSIRQIHKYLNGKLLYEEQIADFRNKIQHIENAIEQLSLRNLKSSSVSNVSETLLGEIYCICKDVVVTDIDDGINAFTETYFDCLRRKYCLDKYHNNFCEFPKDILSDDLYDTTDFSMKICIAIESNEKTHDCEFFPETKAVVISYCGSYENGLLAYKALQTYIKENNLLPNGYPREYYLEGNFDNTHDNNIVYIAVPIK